MPTKSEIGKIASKKTKKEFAEQLSSYTSLTQSEVATLFPKASDREALVELMKIVNSDADDKAKQAKLIANIQKYAGAVIGMGKKLLV